MDAPDFTGIIVVGVLIGAVGCAVVIAAGYFIFF